MAYTFKSAEKIVGIFILVLGFVLVVALVMVGRGQNWFEKRYVYKSWFKSGAGLKPGMGIIFNGTSIGTVTRVKLKKKNTIDLEFTITEEYHDRIRKDTVVKHNIPLIPIGGHTLEIVLTASKGYPAPNGSFIYSTDSDEGKAMLKVKKKGDFEQKAADLIGNISGLVGQLQDPVGPLFGTLENVEKLTGELVPLIADLQRKMRKVELQRINSLLISLDKTCQEVSAVTGTLKDSSGDIAKTIANLEKMTRALAQNPIITLGSKGEEEEPKKKKK